MLKKSDIISLHLPFLQETKHTINSSNINLIKPSAIIINTARGELIETKALLNALNEGRLAGLGLDVIEGESLIREEKELLHKKNEKEMKQIIQDLNIIRNDRVVFTPHIAFYSQEALTRIVDTSIENINLFINKKPQNLIKNV